MQLVNHQLELALQHKSAGRLADAQQCCEEVLRENMRQADALHLLGAILFSQGKIQDAVEKLSLAVAEDPTNTRYLITLGGNLAICGRIAEAESHFAKAAALDPTSIEAIYNLGLAQKHLGKFKEADSSFRRVIHTMPDHLNAIANLALVLIESGQLAEAKWALSRALELQPTNYSWLVTMAKLLFFEGNLLEAEASYIRAITQQPLVPQARLELAMFHMFVGHPELGTNSLNELVRLTPQSAEAWTSLSSFQCVLKMTTDAVVSARKAVSLDPNLASAWIALAQASADDGNIDDARAAYDRSMAISPSNARRIARDFLLPSVLGTRDEIERSRKTLEENIERLVAEGIRDDGAAEASGYTGFYLAFHGKNDRRIQRKIADLFVSMSPSLQFRAPHCEGSLQARADGPIRVGFYSRHIYSHSITFCFGQVMLQLAQMGKFDVVLISDMPFREEVIFEKYRDFPGRKVQVPGNLSAARRVIAALELDALVYLDIGMDSFSYFLAFSRLAHIQCVMAGHPTTTGIRTIDYFLSAERIEPANADDHYTEKLIRLKHGGVLLTRPTIPQFSKSREALGLPLKGNIYLCPVMLQKIHPDFDRAIAKILSRDDTGTVVFFEGFGSSSWAKLLKQRFERTIPALLRKRILFHPWVSDKDDFLRVIKLSSVVLDPFHFGIGTTGLHVVAVGSPLITLPGEFLRGRCAVAYCKQLDIPECVANDEDDYVAKAVSIATDESLRSRISEKIQANSSLVFDEQGAAAEFASTLQELVLSAKLHNL